MLIIQIFLQIKDIFMFYFKRKKNNCIDNNLNNKNNNLNNNLNNTDSIYNYWI